MMMMREQPPTVTNCVTTMQCVNMPVTDCVTMHHAMEPFPY